jgi:hypothetical protein
MPSVGSRKSGSVRLEEVFNDLFYVQLSDSINGIFTSAFMTQAAHACLLVSLNSRFDASISNNYSKLDFIYLVFW